jgi:beta-glucosidase
VLETGNPVRMPWADKVGGVLEAWYGGAKGGEAIARVLFGEVDASGRLPLTWPKDESQLPRPGIPGAGLAAIGIPPQGKPQQDIDYDIEGADVGYRWFERRHLEPLFAFGYGLSYTTFDYGKPTVQNHDGQITVSLRITNTGKRAGVTVPQLYVAPPKGDTTKRLAGWQRVSLKPGESREVRIVASPVRLAHFDEAQRQWVRDAGRYRFELGHTSAATLMVDLSLDLPAATCTLNACRVSP